MSHESTSRVVRRPEDDGSVPFQLRQLDRWLVAKIETVPDDQDKPSKPPVLPKSPTATADGLSFDRALQIAEDPSLAPPRARTVGSNEPTLVGFMLTSEDDFCFVDWDDVRDPTEGNKSVPEFILDHIRSLGGYTEISPSKTGLKSICLSDGSLQALLDDYGYKSSLDHPIVGSLDDEPEIEIYNDKHYTTVTGSVFRDPRNGRPFNSLSKGGQPLLQIAEQHLPDQDSASAQDTQNPPSEVDSLTDIGRQVTNTRRQGRNKTSQQKTDHTDGEWVKIDNPTIDQIRATGCALDDDFQYLWEGNTSRYPTVSEADEALVSKLWYYSDDRRLVDNAFRRSGLYGIRLRRSSLSKWSKSYPKWDQKSYRENTLDSTRDNARHSGYYLDPDK